MTKSYNDYIKANEELVLKQLQLQFKNIDDGVARFMSKEEGKSIANKKSFGILQERISSFYIDAIVDYSMKTHRRRVSGIFLKNLEPGLVAFVATKVIINNMDKKDVSLTNVAHSIYTELINELKFIKLKKDNKGWFKAVEKNLKTNNLGFKQKVFKVNFKIKDISVFELPKEQQLIIGLDLVKLFIESTGLVQIIDVNTKGKSKKVISGTKELDAALDDMDEKLSLSDPVKLPMLIKPTPWSGLVGGGYLAMDNNDFKAGIIKGSTGSVLRKLKGSYLEDVYDVLNTLQDTPWVVNEKILKVAEHYFNNGTKKELKSLDMVSPEIKEVLPVGDVFTSGSEEDQKKWKEAAKKVYEDRIKEASKRTAILQKFHIANKFKVEPAIYMPYNLDFRGRVYPLPEHLNPQGDDLAKGLLKFAIGKRLGTTGETWLRFHIANTYGEDKISKHMRISWSYDNIDMIRSIVADPINDKRWVKTDSPFKFLSACQDLVAYLDSDDKENYLSYTAVALDGSCSGIQHYSAMLKDKVGGASVNLIDSELPNDVYKVVADKLIEILNEEALTNPEASKKAQEWLNYGITRSVVKRNVMTTPYGVTQQGIFQQLLDYMEKEDDYPATWEIKEMCLFLRPYITKALAGSLQGATKGMDFLKSVAKVCNKADIDITWITPIGFTVVQDYKKSESKDLTCFNGSYRVKVSTKLKTINKIKQAGSIAPNFIHSMDAAHLMLTVQDAAANGVTDFAVIHDSFGTHAGDTEQLNKSIRKAFHDIYSDNVLEDFLEQIKEQIPEELHDELPSVPTMGDLNIDCVLTSTYIFS